jgi:hypothetical protein
MAEQIMSGLGTYIGWNIFALLLILLAAEWPKVARLLFFVQFFGGAVWNLFASLTMPQFYVDTYGPVATPPYAAFIYGWFAGNPALFVVPIAIGELAIAVLAAGRGTSVRLSMLGVIGFMIGLAPLGVGGAFPYSIFAIIAAFVLFRKRFDTTLFDDVGTRLSGLGHAIWPRGRARAHS